MLLAHALSIITRPPYPFGGTNIAFDGLEDYVDNKSNTDSSEDPFSDDKDSFTVWLLFL